MEGKKFIQDYGGVILLGGVAIYAISKLGKLLGPGDKPLEDSKSNPKVPTSGSPDGSVRQFTDAEIASIAKSQLQAMDRFGTNESQLFDTLKALNGTDLRRVFNAFGTVRYSNTLGQGSVFFSTPLDLFGWYRAELGSSDLNKMRSIWEKSGLRI